MTFTVKRWYRSNLRDGERKVQPVNRWRAAPLRRSLPRGLVILKTKPRVLCLECGANTRTASATCRTCFDLKTFRSDLQRLRNATLITAAEVEHDWVFADGYGYNDGYFYSLDDLLEHCECEEIDPPCYVHPCYPCDPPKIDLESDFERIAENQWEGFETSDLAGVDDLIAAVDAFNAKQTSNSWLWDASEVIVIDAERFEHLLSHDRNGLPDVRYISRGPVDKSKREMAERTVPEVVGC